MDKQLLFYERAVPVSKERHRDHAIRPGSGYGFAGSVNAVPVVMGEFARLSREYPIVFVKAGESYSAVALCGLRDDENLFVEADGSWSADYIPAFVRRYPFVFHKQDDNYTLCIDEAHPGLNTQGEGRKLFGDDGEPTDFLDEMIKFTTAYQSDVGRTSDFAATLDQLGLLSSAQISFALPDGSKAATRGLYSVDEDKLNALSGDDLRTLIEGGHMKALYAHILSLQTVELFGSRIAKRSAAA